MVIYFHGRFLKLCSLIKLLSMFLDTRWEKERQCTSYPINQALDKRYAIFVLLTKQWVLSRCHTRSLSFLCLWICLPNHSGFFIYWNLFLKNAKIIFFSSSILFESQFYQVTFILLNYFRNSNWINLRDADTGKLLWQGNEDL